MDLYTLIETYGYLIVFLGAVFEGEIIVLLAGFVAHEGVLFLPAVLVVGFVGAVVGDATWFLLGKHKADVLLAKFPWLAKVLAHPMLRVHANPRTLACTVRFMYGLRSVIPFSLGMSGLSTKTFLLWNSLGALIWVVAVTVLGYLFGDVAQEIVGTIKQYELRIIVGTVLAIALFYSSVRILRFAYGVYVGRADR
jgi:membrane protein DedA with SNARE-associated domain